MYFFEFLYYLGLSAKKHYTLKYRKQLPARVLSIGNLTLGGTGKTPAAIAVAEAAKKRGLRPVILTRGYRGKVNGPCFVTQGDGPLLTVEESGDEPFLMANKLSGVPVIKSADRYLGGLFALEQLKREDPGSLSRVIFILDDGFQHWQLVRDKDIVLLDSANPFGNGLLLPFGRLREPKEALARADIIVLTKRRQDEAPQAHTGDELVNRIRQLNSNAPVYYAVHAPVACRSLSGETMAPGFLAGKRLFGFCALGSPASFKRTIETMGGVIAGFQAFRDHHPYSPGDMAKIKEVAEATNSEWIVTTEKDIIKIKHLDLPGNILIIEINFSVEREFYEQVFKL